MRADKVIRGQAVLGIKRNLRKVSVTADKFIRKRPGDVLGINKKGRMHMH